jgi:CubicO group peptidase (beta-lactamase class C family)
MKRILKWFLAFVAFLVVVSWATNYSYVWGGIRETYLRGWKNANIDDIEFRDLVEIPASNPVPWPEAMLDEGALSPQSEQALLESEASSFLVVYRDTIRYEKYWKGHDRHTLTNSFSMAKSITALVVGLASDAGFLAVSDLVGQVAPRMGNELTVEHLLQMRSHIPFGENYKNPFAFMAKAYYRDGVGDLLADYGLSENPGTNWKYQGGNTMLLEEVVSKRSGTSLSTWVERGLWGPMGSESNAYWGVDASVDPPVERCFAQFYATTRDFARFGKLLSDSGRWESKQLVPRAYVERMLTPVNTLDSSCSATHYGYQIWLGQTDDDHPFSVMEGHRGQFVITVPSLDIVCVRTGYDKPMATKRNVPEEAYRVIAYAREVLQAVR